MFTSPHQKRAFLRDLRAHQATVALATDPADLVEPVCNDFPQLLRDLANAVKLDVVSFYEAVPINADITQVRDRWFLWLLCVELKPHDKKGHCEAVAKLYERRLKGDEPSKEERKAAAAYAAAYADAAAADAAYAAWNQKREECYQRCRDVLTRLLRTAPRVRARQQESAAA